MPDRNAPPGPELFHGLDDVEWELVCSAREATVGYIPDPEVWSRLAPGSRVHPHPWNRQLEDASRHFCNPS